LPTHLAHTDHNLGAWPFRGFY